MQNERLVEVKQSIESTEESRKTETLSKIETKLTVAEQKREQEIQRKLENIKVNVRIYISIACLAFSVSYIQVGKFCVHLYVLQ